MVELLALTVLLAASDGAPVSWSEADRKVLIDGLTETRDRLVAATKGLTPEQWRFKEEPARWSIAEVVEHLGLQDDAYFREMSVAASQPTHAARLRAEVEKQDALILQYADDTEKGAAPWLIEPLGRWSCEPAKGVTAFLRTRERLMEFVRTSKKDLRRQLTFREYTGKGNRWSVRDLHQLMLTNIAHLRRHAKQIERVKAHTKYPR